MYVGKAQYKMQVLKGKYLVKTILFAYRDKKKQTQVIPTYEVFFFE